MDTSESTPQSAIVERECEEWLEARPDEAQLCFLGVEGSRLQLLLGQEHEFYVIIPEGYPKEKSGFFVESASSQALWCNAMNEYVLERDSLSVADILTRAIDTYKTVSSKQTASSEDYGGDDDDDDEYGDFDEDPDDDYDGDDDAFTTGWDVEITKLKKVWTAREDALRAEIAKKNKAEKEKRAADPVESMFSVVLPTSAESDQAQQIFSTSAASRILVNDLVKIMELKDWRDRSQTCSQQSGISAEPIDDNIYSWKVHLSNFSPDSALAQDAAQLKEAFGYDFVELQLDFALDLFPFYPPTAKVVRPRLADSMMQRIANLEILRLSNCDRNPTTNMQDLLGSIREILEQYARLTVTHPMNNRSLYPDGAYFDLEHDLLRLAMVSEIPPRANSRYQIEAKKAPRVMSKAEKKAKEDKEGKAKDKQYWAAGTGYGHGDRYAAGWDTKAYLAAQKEKDTQLVRVLMRCLDGLRKIPTTESEESSFTVHDAYPVVEGSCLVPFLAGQVLVTSVLEITRHARLFQAVLSIIDFLSKSDHFLMLLAPLPDQSVSLHELLQNQQTQLELFVSRVSRAGGASATDSSVPVEVATAQTIIDIAKRCTAALKAKGISVSRRKPEKSPSSSTKEPAKESAALSDKYMEVMGPFQFDTCDLSAKKFKHIFAAEAPATNSKQILRIAQELSALSTSLPLNLSSSVFVRADEERVHLMRALITGPEGTPYSAGCFIFDIYFPSTYPQGPPSVKIVTTGGGSVRFNPNLYANGKVCLSLLGTWEGQAGESWSSDSSTLLQVLVSIQSLILVPEPWFNEPGYESTMGTEEGKANSATYNAGVRGNTIKLAMLDQLENPDPQFKDIINAHFYLRKAAIIKQVDAWVQEAQTSDSPVPKSHLHSKDMSVGQLQTLVRRLKSLLAQLPAV